MASLRFQRFILEKIRPLLRNRQISTSKKNQETVAVADASKFTKIDDKNWISFGFDRRHKDVDRISAHLLLFGGITVCLVGTTFAVMYAPDVNLRDWSQREAFIQLRHRESKGLPPIDANLINPHCVKLPTDEELGDTDIII